MNDNTNDEDVTQRNDTSTLVKQERHNNGNNNDIPASTVSSPASPSTTGSSTSTPTDSSNSITRERRRSRLTKRNILIESKLKNIKVRSLFDTDGDISSHNILAPEDGASRPTRSRKRKSSDVDGSLSSSSSSTATTATSASDSSKRRYQQRQHKQRQKQQQEQQQQQQQHRRSVSPTVPRKAGRPPGAQNKRRRLPLSEQKVLLEQSEQPQQRKQRGQAEVALKGKVTEVTNAKRRGRKPTVKPEALPSPMLKERKLTQKVLTPAESAELLMQQRQKSVQLLRPAPKSQLGQLRNDSIRERELKLQRYLAQYDMKIREFAHLEVYQSIIDYNPSTFNMDERVTKFLDQYNIWEIANNYLLDKQQHANINRVRTRHLQDQHLPLIRMLQHSSELDALTNKHNIPSVSQQQQQQQQMLLPPAAVHTIRSGTGVRRMHRQYSTLDAYLSTFVFLDDNEDCTQEQVNISVEKEREILRRIREMEQASGFTTRWKDMANRRPQHVDPPLRRDGGGVYESVVSQTIAAAKNFHGHSKYRKNAARKCARAIDKYWENIRTREERAQREETKRLTKLAKWTVQQVRSKWRVVERICEARHKELIKEEQAMKSRRHLELILEHSEQMLGVRMDELAQQQQQPQHEHSLPDTPRSSEKWDADEEDEDEEEEEEEEEGERCRDFSVPLNGDEYVSDGTPRLESLDDWADTSDEADEEDQDVRSSGDQAEDDDEQDHIIDESDVDSDEHDDGDEDENLTLEQLVQKYQHLQENDDNEQRASEEEEEEETDNSDSQALGLGMLVSRTFDTERAADDDSEYASTASDIHDDHDNDDIIFSDGADTEDDDQLLSDLAAESQLSLDNLRKRYPLSSSQVKDDSQDVESCISSQTQQDHSTAIPPGSPDINKDSSHSKSESNCQVDTASSSIEAEQNTVSSVISISPSQQTDFSVSAVRKASLCLSDTEDVNHVTKRQKIDIIDVDKFDRNEDNGDTYSLTDNEDVDDDDRTVTDYGSEPPEDEDDNVNTVEQKDKVLQIEQQTTDAESESRDSTAATVETESVQEEQQIEAPTGTTLSTTKVDTPIPFLLRGTLREYQHVGLDWLVSLYNNGLNGILADEMGLGKTIQTIALLASLACDKGIWGPHLVVVPTSVILNWEMEFKRWLPGFKILTYYGNPKERKEKRSGWSKENAFHVCITSYQLVLQDQSAFRRKAWQYLILDEAHHIKNFRSQRWQVLLNFNSKRRLLLTGTPLQNNLMELWSLLYFLMPNGVSSSMPIGFANLKEFQEWFSSPVDRMIESQQGMNEESRHAIQKLHTVLRPYLLRRLKADVEQQMPAKYEHVMYCRLSKRQRYLYDDFMGRSKTKETLASGNFLSIINTLMQLRKVCNHPDLFEERPIVTSFGMTSEIQDHGKQLETWTRRQCLDLPDATMNLEALNLLIVRPTVEEKMSQWISEDYTALDCSHQILEIIRQRTLSSNVTARGIASTKKYLDLQTHAKYHAMQQEIASTKRWESLYWINQRRCQQRPLLGAGLLRQCREMFARPHHVAFFATESDVMTNCVLGYEDRIQRNMDIIERYAFVTPAAIIPTSPSSSSLLSLITTKAVAAAGAATATKDLDHHVKDILHPLTSRLQIAFPDKRLLQYDCGKLQRLATLLQQLAAGGHRALIFTQMTRVLDVLEAFLNMHGYRYLRLDGATKVEQRQLLTEQFNSDKRILCFILSTRSGGLGINLTGADTVIFYDSDWNPSMDKQCQDRAHRIGQLRDVHIYRFVTEYTIEENIFKKANQKRLLDDMVIQEGEFTNDYFQKMDWWKDLPEVTGSGNVTASVNSNIDMEQALLEAEGEKVDAQAAIAARNEMTMDDEEFSESSATPRTLSRQTLSPSPSISPKVPSPISPPTTLHASLSRSSSSSMIVTPSTTKEEDEEEDLDLVSNRESYHSTTKSVAIMNDQDENQVGDEEEKETELDVEVGHVDQYMLRFWEREMFGQYLGFGGLPEPIDQ